VLDLGRVAGNPKLVVPFRPEESKLWTLLRDGDMPPEDTPGGPLSAAEKEAVRAWIAAGGPTAPAPPTAGPPSPTAAAPEGRTSGPGETASGKRALRWLGKLHIPLIHFPVALLLAAALGELWSAWRGGRAPSPAVRFCVLLGAGGAVSAALLGWLHADFGGYGAGPALRLHRWVGTATGLCAVAIALLSERDARRGRRSRLFRALLGIGTLLVGAAGHFGGVLVHGEDFFNW
jgi:hypothetical protein